MKRAPSVKRLMQARNIAAEHAGLVRSLIKMEPGMKTFDVIEEWAFRVTITVACAAVIIGAVICVMQNE